MFLIDSIDKIARKKQRDVFFVKFHYGEENNIDLEFPLRCQIIEWLDMQNINWEPSAPYSDGIASYQGDIYIDIPLDQTNKKFQEMIGYFDKEDGSPRIPGCSLHLLKLNDAMLNEYQDVPGFWENY